MKALILVAAALLSALPAVAATNIISRPNNDLGDNYLLTQRPLAVGWSTTQDFDNVLITAQLTGSSVTAYLVTEMDVDYQTDYVAVATVAPGLPGNQSATITLFSGLSLPASNYYLILNGAGTWVDNPSENIVRDGSVTSLGSYILYPYPAAGPFPATLDVSPANNSLIYSVVSIPEPGFAMMGAAAPVLLIVRRKRSR